MVALGPSSPQRDPRRSPPRIRARRGTAASSSSVRAPPRSAPRGPPPSRARTPPIVDEGCLRRAVERLSAIRLANTRALEPLLELGAGALAPREGSDHDPFRTITAERASESAGLGALQPVTDGESRLDDCDRGHDAP